MTKGISFNASLDINSALSALWKKSDEDWWAVTAHINNSLCRINDENAIFLHQICIEVLRLLYENKAQAIAESPMEFGFRVDDADVCTRGNEGLEVEEIIESASDYPFVASVSIDSSGMFFNPQKIFETPSGDKIKVTLSISPKPGY